MNALAIMPAYNEADIIGWSVRHLIAQGLDVYVIDCASTDATVATAVAAGATVEHYPVQDGRVRWRSILKRVEEIAEFQIGRYDWCMLNDADEIRDSALTLLIHMDVAQTSGFNCIECEVITFHPVDNGYDGSQDPQKYFRYYTRDAMNERIGQQRAWRNEAPVELAWSGGHKLRFRQRVRNAPWKIYSKHYPIRSQAHGERKVFTERRGRWSDPEKDWHIQYAGIERGHNFLRRPEDLEEWGG